jgi:hypothetical protein
VIRHRLAPLLALALALAACGGAAPSSGTGSAGSAAVSSSGAPAASTAEPTAASTAAASGEEPSAEPPSDTPAPEVTPKPVATPSRTAPPTDAPSTPSGSAEACSGNDANRVFLAGVARAVAWPVLCAVLPKGWFVSQGSYRMANGGKLLMSYKGPGGATLALSEGSYCADGTGCVPAGTDAGDASLGTMPGTLVALDNGGFAIVVDKGSNPGWLLVTKGLDQAATVDLGAALAVVGG